LIAAVIRRATADELDEIARVFLAARLKMEADGIAPFVHPPDSVRPFLARVMREGPMFAGVWQGRIAAMMAMTQGWLDHLYVEPPAQGNGLGTALLKTALREPEADHGLQLWCFQANAPARRLYERHGFVVEELTDGHGNEEKAPDVRYALRR
jgi:GNAT superfamily N-acetyltransferase